MGNPEERNKKHDNVKELLLKIASFDSKKLARSEDLSPHINFAEAVPYFEIMFDIAKQLNDRDLSRLTEHQLDVIINACQQLLTRIEQVNKFDINVNTPADVCKGIIDGIKNFYDSFMEPLLLPLAFTASQATDYAKIEREAKGYHATMKQEHGKLMGFFNQIKGEASNALSAVQAQVAEAGVSTNAQIFIEDSNNHRDDARNWFKATWILSGVTLIAAIVFLISGIYYIPEKTESLIQFVVSKIIVLSTLYFGIFWCSQNYKAEKHNQTLNQHRANALMTFRAFVEGTSDDRVKDAILLHAAQAAFTPRPTGFDSQEKEVQSVNPIVEVLGKSFSKPLSND